MEPTRWDFAIGIGLVVANVVAFLHLGFHARVPLFWIFTFGAVDLQIGTGFFATAYWVPRALAENAKEARILTYVFWMTFGLMMTVPNILRG